MPRKDNLLRLLDTLTPAEKKSFTRYTGLVGGDKRYLKLFDALQGMQEYDTKALCTQLNLKPQQLADDKNHLNNVLLASLRNNTKSLGTVDTIYTYLADARMLYVRSLDDQALIVIEKALTAAWKMESFEVIDDLLTMKHWCLYNINKDEVDHTVYADYKKVNAISLELAELRYLDRQNMMFENQRKPASAAQAKLLKHPLLNAEPDMLLSFRARVMRFDIIYNYYGRQGDKYSDRLLKFVHKEWAYYQAHPEIKKIARRFYVNCYIHLAETEFLNKNYTKALKIIDGLDVFLRDKDLILPGKPLNDSKEYGLIFRIGILFKLRRFKDADLQAVEVSKFIKNKIVYYQIGYLFNHAATLLHLGRSAEAINKLNAIQDANTDMRIDLQQYARILMIPAQIDLENYRLVPFMIKNTKAWIKRNKYKLPEFETFFSLITAVTKAGTRIARKKAYADLNNAIKAGKLKEINGRFLLDVWAESKLRNI